MIRIAHERIRAVAGSGIGISYGGMTLADVEANERGNNDYEPDPKVWVKIPNSNLYINKNTGKIKTAEQIQKEEKVVQSALSFEKGKSYPIKIISKNWGVVTAGLLGAGYNQTTVSYNGENIESSGIVTGAGLGSEFLTKVGANNITFHTNMSGNSLKDIFNQTGLVEEKTAGAVVTYGTIIGYDSANNMNKLWSANVHGSGLKAGVSSTRSTEPFK